ncbi:hypothetical protein ABIB35_002301 [Arthrobacter sp. UYP6]
MTETENPATGDDQDRTHTEAPSEGETSAEADTQRQHTQDAAEGDEAEKK